MVARHYLCAKNLLTPPTTHCFGGSGSNAGSSTPIRDNASTGSITARGLGGTTGKTGRDTRDPERGVKEREGVGDNDREEAEEREDDSDDTVTRLEDAENPISNPASKAWILRER